MDLHAGGDDEDDAHSAAPENRQAEKLLADAKVAAFDIERAADVDVLLTWVLDIVRRGHGSARVQPGCDSSEVDCGMRSC